jgi:hypothetical protein
MLLSTTSLTVAAISRTVSMLSSCRSSPRITWPDRSAPFTSNVSGELRMI